MYILCLFKFMIFLCGKLTKSINNKKPQNFNKTAALSHHCPLRHPAPSLGIGIPGYTFGYSIQARAIPPSSWGSAPPVTTGSLYSLQWASPPSTLQKRRLHSLFMIVF